jgi:hypothetical protein
MAVPQNPRTPPWATRDGGWGRLKRRREKPQGSEDSALRYMGWRMGLTEAYSGGLGIDILLGRIQI